MTLFPARAEAAAGEAAAVGEAAEVGEAAAVAVDTVFNRQTWR